MDTGPFSLFHLLDFGLTMKDSYQAMHQFNLLHATWLADLA